MPLYTGDWLRDTRHLSCAEQGIYFCLVMHCWNQQGPAPLDERRLCGIVNARSGDEVEAMRRVLTEFFVRTDDGYFNTKVEEVLADSRRRVDIAAKAGRASGAARREKARIAAEILARTTVQHPFNDGSTTVERQSNYPSPSPTPSPTSKTKDKDTGAALRTAPATAPPAYDGSNENAITERHLVCISEDFELPESWGVDAEALGFKPAEVIREAEKYRQYWTVGKGSGKRRTLKGWRQSWSNWLSKAAERVTP